MRGWILVGLVAAAALAAVPARAGDTSAAETSRTGDPQLKTRRVRLEYGFEVEAPAGAKSLEVWFPVPHDSDWQTVADLKLVGATEIRTAPQLGNTMAHAKVDAPKGKVGFGFSATVTRREHLNRYFRSHSKELSPEEQAKWKVLLQPTRLIPFDGPLAAYQTEELKDAEAPGKLTLLNVARKFYEVVLRDVEYKKEGTGWGRGDVAWVCDKRYGNCSDFHSLFMGLCRRRGIPANFAIGVPLPPERGAGPIGGYHCWAEFYVPDVGWIPVDISEARKDAAMREYYFGGHTEDRIELSAGRDLTLDPPQKAPPLNFFVYPHVEVDGAAVEGVKPAMKYEDVK